MTDNHLTDYLTAIRTSYADHHIKMNNGADDTTKAIRAEMYDDFCANLRFEVGNKYIKIITKNSVHSFIVNTDKDREFKRGDILKANSWTAPARNFARGNIVKKQYGNLSWTGVA